MELIDTIRKEGDKLHAMIRGLLNLASIKADTGDIERRRISIHHLVSAAIDLFRDKYPDKTITTNFEDNLPEIEGSRIWLSQVMAQVLSNAVKFTGEDTCIGVSVRSLEDRALVCVSDNGCGILGCDIPLVFQDFYQVQSGYTDKTQGIGIGLSLSKWIVESHGGEIWMESPGPDQGCTVYFTLPLAG